MGNQPSALKYNKNPNKKPCRVDLREHWCFPYPPVENQGTEVSCVCRAFALALYCIGLQYKWNTFPTMKSIFDEALKSSSNKDRGVSFEAVVQGTKKLYGELLGKANIQIVKLPNDAEILRQFLNQHCPIIVGYQVDEQINAFHRNKDICKEKGYLLPPFHHSAVSLSGHAVIILGYDFQVQSFIARNSWGADWGVDGHFLIPFLRIEDKAAVTDIWTLKKQK